MERLNLQIRPSRKGFFHLLMKMSWISRWELFVFIKGAVSGGSEGLVGPEESTSGSLIDGGDNPKILYVFVTRTCRQTL